MGLDAPDINVVTVFETVAGNQVFHNPSAANTLVSATNGKYFKITRPSVQHFTNSQRKFTH